jgi:hypothetical protein
MCNKPQDQVSAKGSRVRRRSPRKKPAQIQAAPGIPGVEVAVNPDGQLIVTISDSIHTTVTGMQIIDNRTTKEPAH